jgi:zona occludens toxin
MAIIAYTGVMGSGKTYEAVSTAALTALRAGRRVVTNISGFNFEKVRDYLGPFSDGALLEADKVVVIPTDRILQDHFFYDPEVSAESCVKPGDLVLVDEVWSCWGTDKKLLAEHQKFFRMHRHYTEADTGISCDLVLMIQDLGSLHRFIRSVLESNLKFTKMKSLGLHSRYQVVVFEGRGQRKANIVSVSTKKYDKSIFPLYKSYDVGAGKEATVDGRANLFNNKLFLTVFFGAIVGLLYAGWWFIGYVNHLRNGGRDESEPSVSSPTATANTGNPSASGPSTSSQSASPLVSANARLVGILQLSSGETLMLIQLEDGRIIRQMMRAGLIDGWQTVAGYENRMVSFSFGSKNK